MPDPKGLFFVINERQVGWGSYPGMATRLPYATTDAEPLPAEPEAERSTFTGRLAARLRPSIRRGGAVPRPRSGQGPASA